MSKILKILGLGNIENSFADFEQKLKDIYIKDFIMDIFLCVACLIFTITSKYYKASIMFALLIILLLLLHTYRILQLLCGKVYMFEGTVLSDDKSSIQGKVLFSTIKILGTSKIKIKYNDNIYNIPVAHNAKYEKGSTARVYMTLESISKISENEYDVISPILVYPVIDA